MIATAVLMALSSCLRQKSPEQIFDDEVSGVALVMNRYYYAVTFEDDEEDVMYFSRLDDDGDIDLDDISTSPDSVSRQTVFGTAFFIDKEGTLLTNRHVVDLSGDIKQMRHSVKDFVKLITAYYETSQEELEEEYAKLERQISANNKYYGYNAPANDRLRRRQKELEAEYAENADAIDEMKSIDMSEITVKACCEISIAYHDQFATVKEDFKPCVVVRTSKDEDVDLAMIRLKTKKTPEEAHVFTLPQSKKAIFGPSQEERETLKLHQPIVMIGFNQGPLLGNTDEGLQAQLTVGNVSQLPDDDRVMYTIPMLPGSSGSPVVNLYGEVVAVNFAGMQGTQSFNFGIPLNRIKEFLDKK